jgi:hypothetical protein
MDIGKLSHCPVFCHPPSDAPWISKFQWYQWAKVQLLIETWYFARLCRAFGNLSSCEMPKAE